LITLLSGCESPFNPTTKSEILPQETTSRNLDFNFDFDDLTFDERAEYDAWAELANAEVNDPEPSDLIPFDSELDDPTRLSQAGWTKHSELPCEHMVEQFGDKATFACADCYAVSKDFRDAAHLNRTFEAMFSQGVRS
jgi:hypothetical protein